jgi:hypothetical protein
MCDLPFPFPMQGWFGNGTGSKPKIPTPALPTLPANCPKCGAAVPAPSKQVYMSASPFPPQERAAPVQFLLRDAGFPFAAAVGKTWPTRGSTLPPPPTSSTAKFIVLYTVRASKKRQQNDSAGRQLCDMGKSYEMEKTTYYGRSRRVLHEYVALSRKSPLFPSHLAVQK